MQSATALSHCGLYKVQSATELLCLYFYRFDIVAIQGLKSEEALPTVKIKHINIATYIYDDKTF